MIHESTSVGPIWQTFLNLFEEGIIQYNTRQFIRVGFHLTPINARDAGMLPFGKHGTRPAWYSGRTGCISKTGIRPRYRWEDPVHKEGSPSMVAGFRWMDCPMPTVWVSPLT